MYGNCFTFNTSKVNSSVSATGPYNGEYDRTETSHAFEINRIFGNE